MKKRTVVLALLAVLSHVPGVWAFESGSACKTSTDPKCLGAFSPTTSTVVDLPADGTLNYSTVNIPTGVTVTFKKNTANTPVTILASGDVTIAGAISLNGSDASGIYPGSGGPGGYDGGIGGPYSIRGGRGLGPGGGDPGVLSTCASVVSLGGGGGGFESKGATIIHPATCSSMQDSSGGTAYGNERLLPLVGGSGGGGGAPSTAVAHSSQSSGGGGGGGAGAILIASSGKVTLSGSITANGGKGIGPSGNFAGGGGGGSGGGLRLVASTITGAGSLSAVGGAGGASGSGYQVSGGAGSPGRIRIETESYSFTGAISPATFRIGRPGPLVPTGVPTLSITSVGGVQVPAGALGKFGQPDINLPAGTSNPVTVTVAGVNVPVGTQATITAAPENGAATTATANLTGTLASSTASAPVTLSTTYQNILTAQVTFAVQIAMRYDGEKVDKVQIATTMGGTSKTTYITESGREIPAEELVARVEYR